MKRASQQLPTRAELEHALSAAVNQLKFNNEMLNLMSTGCDTHRIMQHKEDLEVHLTIATCIQHCLNTLDDEE